MNFFFKPAILLKNELFRRYFLRILFKVLEDFFYGTNPYNSKYVVQGLNKIMQNYVNNKKNDLSFQFSNHICYT